MKELLQDYFENLRAPVSQADINRFEEEHNLTMPDAMRQFYLLTNGAALIRHDIFKEEEYIDYVYDIVDIQGVASYFSGIDRNNKDVGYIINEIAHIMPIGNTSGRSLIFIGHSGPYQDKVYISGDLDDETGIIPIVQIGDSFTQFITNLR